jgi:hypothetical protein
MNQVIFLSFNCFTFKKSPKAQLLINDVFIDEFEIPEFISNDFLENIRDNEDYKSYIQRSEKQVIKGKSPMIKLWEIDNSAFDRNNQNKIEIKIFNDDNNYTNGLMTLSTLIELKDFYILPKKLLSTNILDRYRFKQKNFKAIDKIADYYKQRTVFFENLNEYTHFTRDWDKKTVLAEKYIVGGSGTFRCLTYAKHGFQKSDTKPGYWRIRNENMKYIINKYSKAYENQRNHN